MKRLNLQTVDRPQVDIECAGRVIQSTVIANARRNPNFQHPVDFFDVVCDAPQIYFLAIRLWESFVDNIIDYFLVCMIWDKTAKQFLVLLFLQFFEVVQFPIDTKCKLTQATLSPAVTPLYNLQNLKTVCIEACILLFGNQFGSSYAFLSTVQTFSFQELPENERYCPPLTVRVRDCRTFGRFSLVGTHVLNSLHRYRHPKEGESMERASIKDVTGNACMQASQPAATRVI